MLYTTYSGSSGFKCQAPSDEVALLDSNICRHMICNNCGHYGMEYYPYMEYNNNVYVAIAKCPNCGHEKEF